MPDHKPYEGPAPVLKVILLMKMKTAVSQGVLGQSYETIRKEISNIIRNRYVIETTKRGRVFHSLALREIKKD